MSNQTAASKAHNHLTAAMVENADVLVAFIPDCGVLREAGRGGNGVKTVGCFEVTRDRKRD